MRKSDIAEIVGAGVAGILFVALILGIGYGVTLAMVGIVMWALVKLSIIEAWTWGQAALWALIAYIVYVFIPKPSGNKSND